MPGVTAEPAAMIDQARASLEAGRISECQTLCEAILRQDPTHRRALLLLGLAHMRTGDIAGGLNRFDALTILDPSLANAWFHRGNCLIELSRYDDAAASFRRATRLRPDHAIGHYGHAGALICLGRHQEALPILERAHELAPSNPAIQNLLATTLKWTGGIDAAMRHFEALTKTFPDFVAGWFGKGLLHLLLGDFPIGWQLLEWRFRQPNRAIPREIARFPRWNGQPVPRGTTILAHSDGGLGDAIQFCRFAPLAAATGAHISLLVPPSLTRLMRGLQGVDRVLTEGEKLPTFDFQCPLMSLPASLGITLDTVPATVPYLHPAPESVAAWSNRLDAGCRVGLVWTSGIRPGEVAGIALARRKSVPLAALAPLSAIPGVSFVSLQIGPGLDQAAPPTSGMLDLTDSIRDFEDTAALIHNLDLVISVDTAVAHLAGALGKPVWLMNLFDTDWRWMLERDDSPWYPTLRVFRQSKSGDWTSVVRDIAAALSVFAANRT